MLEFGAFSKCWYTGLSLFVKPCSCVLSRSVPSVLPICIILITTRTFKFTYAILFVSQNSLRWTTISFLNRFHQNIQFTVDNLATEIPHFSWYRDSTWWFVSKHSKKTYHIKWYHLITISHSLVFLKFFNELFTIFYYVFRFIKWCW